MDIRVDSSTTIRPELDEFPILLRRIFEELAKSNGRLVSSDRLRKIGWSPYLGTTQQLHGAISRLRHRISRMHLDITGIREVGYLLIEAASDDRRRRSRRGA